MSPLPMNAPCPVTGKIAGISYVSAARAGTLAVTTPSTTIVASAR